MAFLKRFMARVKGSIGEWVNFFENHMWMEKAALSVSSTIIYVHTHINFFQRRVDRTEQEGFQSRKKQHVLAFG